LVTGIWQSADAYLHQSVATVWDAIGEVGHCSQDNKIKLRIAATHVIRQSKEVTDIAYELCGTNSIIAESDLQTRFQDMHVITQHLQGRPEIYSLVGKHYLGLAVKSPLLS